MKPFTNFDTLKEWIFSTVPPEVPVSILYNSANVSNATSKFTIAHHLGRVDFASMIIQHQVK